MDNRYLEEDKAIAFEVGLRCKKCYDRKAIEINASSDFERFAPCIEMGCDNGACGDLSDLCCDHKERAECQSPSTEEKLSDGVSP